jgi:hypothetical protein
MRSFSSALSGLSPAARRWTVISLLAGCSLVILAALLASPLAKSRAEAEARKRGLVLQIEDLDLGWFHAELKGVTVKLEGVPEIQISLPEILVDFSLSSPRVREIVTRGGKVVISGTFEQVKKSLDDWQSSRPEPDKAEQTGASFSRTEIVRELDVSWTGAFGGPEKQFISGLQVERTSAGLRLGADLVDLKMDGVSAQIAGALLLSDEPRFELSRASKLGASEMRVSWSVEAPETKAPSTAQKEESDDSANLNASLNARLEQNRARVLSLQTMLSFARDRLLPRLPVDTVIDKLWITYRRGQEQLHIGPNSLSLKKSDDLVVSVAPQGATKGTPLSLVLAIKPQTAPSALTMELKGGPVALRTLGIEEGSFGLSGVDQTEISGKFSAELSQDAEILRGGGEAFLEGLTVDSPRLSETLVTFPKLVLVGRGLIKIDGSHYQLEDGTLRLGEASFQGGFEMIRKENNVSLKAHVKSPLVSCQALLDSAPRGLLGSAETMRFDGTFSLDAGVDADTRSLAKMNVRWDFKNNCRVKAVPTDLHPDRFRAAFRREVIGAGNFPLELEFGPYSSSWTPWSEISPYVEKALLVTEDGRFHRHNGFDDRAIESAIRDNVSQGRFVRGASTISMQLAKNLYLSRKKNLARKFQEAALTLLLEQNFQKTELLELYVNVIEFGPGVYGIRQAAEHYFATLPRDLTPAQAFFIASVLPAPTRNYFTSDGTLSESRKAHVQRLLRISHQRGALSDAELALALEEQLVFGSPHTQAQHPDNLEQP